MKTSKYLLSTLKRESSNIKSTSCDLMLRAGMIRQLSSGVYAWLPTGFKVKQKIENIIRKKMLSIGSIEVFTPIIQPVSLWVKSKRFNLYDSELFKLVSKRKCSFVLGPTNEEIITFLLNKEINSYKQLPMIVFQIQTKFRDELRPRFGMIRTKEFFMKDAYSFHMDKKSLQETYFIIRNIYSEIFSCMKLDVYIAQADNGFIGGNCSHEFHVLTDVGEDNIVMSTESNYIANINFATSMIKNDDCLSLKEKIRLVKISNINNIYDLVYKLKISIKKIVKIIVVYANKKAEFPFVALVIRGDHCLNKKKVEKLPQICVPLKILKEEKILDFLGIESVFLGVINFPYPLIIDRSVSIMNNFVSGANIQNGFYLGINWGVDVPLPEVFDLRIVTKEDISPDGKGKLDIKRSLEIAHIFQIGDKYSKLLKLIIPDRNGKKKKLVMGSYGIGINRVIASIIDQNNDKKGILWPEILSPFDVALLPVNMYKSMLVCNTVNKMYDYLCTNEIDVLLDDREDYFGVMLADIELIGITHIIIISENNVKLDVVEYKNRLTNIAEVVTISNILNSLIYRIKNFVY